MRTVVQRVSESRVRIEGDIVGEIQTGLLVLLGIAPDDGEDDIDWLMRKLLNLRIFPDDNGKMNRSVQDVEGGVLVVSQFTLYADSSQGNRPSYLRSAPPEVAIPLYEQFVERLHLQFAGPVASGRFGADMQVELINDGPVTMLLDSKQRAL
jgi:D-tyrosyl-tRNA(Tyr) deacylase